LCSGQLGQEFSVSRNVSLAMIRPSATAGSANNRQAKAAKTQLKPASSLVSLVSRKFSLTNVVD